jgi:hypothetical protein
MNFCCHDDYTGSESFTFDDISIYIGFQNWVNNDASDPTKGIYNTDLSDLENFKIWYASEVSKKNLNAIEQEIKFLPKLDCGDFTESTSFTFDDISIYIGHQNWINNDASDPTKGVYDTDKNETENFRDWYVDQVSQKNLNVIEQDVMHLPSLQADTVVHTINGDVPRGGDADAIIVDVDAEGDTAGDLLVSFDATAAVHTNENYAGENRIKAVELVFDNVEFVSTSEAETGLSLNTSEKQTLIDEQYQDTLGNKTLNYYYDYAMRTDGTEPRNNKSVIGFIDTTANGDGELKTTLGTLVFRVKKDNWRKNTEISNDIKIADVRIWDETCEVERYELQGGCG